MELCNMSPHEKPYLNYSEELWFEWFMDGILNSDIDAKGKIPILHYLLDLNIFESDANGLLKLSSLNHGVSSQEVKKNLQVILINISKTEKGFALVYFLSNFSNKELPPLVAEKNDSSSNRKNIFNKNYFPGEKKSSNLSNLQIAKRWGSQLRPFLNIEQNTIVRLRGEFTCQEDAQWLFSYILNKIRKKSPAKEWEQLSRKRHR
ncbi:MAG: hypothetical protein HOB32_10615 [Nitrospina sp.]|jgi:hypothetical protein|nr:hypothetical protein [Nitrospina sp.]MBT6602087.1 hypothetical protein [Nitrospina sp.]